MSWKVLGKFRVVRVVAEVMRVLARVRSELTIGFAQNNTQRQSGSPLPQLTVTAACTGHNASSVTCVRRAGHKFKVSPVRARSPWTSVEREDIVA